MGSNSALFTPRLEVRPLHEADRARFVELFCDDDFMVFAGTLTEEAANRRFDHMMSVSEEVPFAKQPVVERASGVVVGYTGVDYIEFESEMRLEWGYRLIPECRGRGYATEATTTLLRRARRTFSGELLVITDPLNQPSQNVAERSDSPIGRRRLFRAGAAISTRCSFPRLIEEVELPHRTGSVYITA